MRPLTWYNATRTLGHYKAAQRSGAIAATIGALGHLASIRNPDTTGVKLAIVAIRAGITISGAVTTAVEFVLRAIYARGFTTDFTTASTPVDMATIANTQKMRSVGMGASVLGANGPRICTTVVMSGQVMTADAAPFGMATLPMLQAVTATGTAVALPVGAATPMVDLYRWDGLGDHPPYLDSNEGVLIQPVVAGPATGTFALHVEWTWAEVLA